MQTQTIEVKMSNKLEKDAQGKPVKENYEAGKDAEGKPVVKVRNKVKEEGKKYAVAVTHPTRQDFTDAQLDELLNSLVTSEVRAAVRIAEAEGNDISEISLTVSDLLGDRVEIPDELVESVQSAFNDFLAKAGKSDKARKNNLAMLVAGKNVLTKVDEKILAGYESNLGNFAASLEGDQVGEFAPVLDRASKRLDSAKNANRGELI